MVSVGMAKIHYDQVVPFEINYISFELLSDNEPLWDLARKAHLPNSLKDRWRGVLAHNFHYIWCCYCSSIWEALKKSSHSKPMVSMAVSNIDCCKALAAC